MLEDQRPLAVITGGSSGIVVMAGDPQDASSKPVPDWPQPASQPGGLEAPLAPAADPTKKTEHTTDPQADDPGNGAD